MIWLICPFTLSNTNSRQCHQNDLLSIYTEKTKNFWGKTWHAGVFPERPMVRDLCPARFSQGRLMPSLGTQSCARNNMAPNLTSRLGNGLAVHTR